MEFCQARVKRQHCASGADGRCSHECTVALPHPSSTNISLPSVHEPPTHASPHSLSRSQCLEALPKSLTWPVLCLRIGRHANVGQRGCQGAKVMKSHSAWLLLLLLLFLPGRWSSEAVFRLQTSTRLTPMQACGTRRPKSMLTLTPAGEALAKALARGVSSATGRWI